MWRERLFKQESNFQSAAALITHSHFCLSVPCELESGRSGTLLFAHLTALGKGGVASLEADEAFLKRSVPRPAPVRTMQMVPKMIRLARSKCSRMVSRSRISSGIEFTRGH